MLLRLSVLSSALCVSLLLPRCSALHMASLSSLSSQAFDALHFDNQHLRDLPVDSTTRNYCRQVPNAIFSRVQPTPLFSPRVVAYSPSALQLLGLDPSALSEEEMAQHLSGNTLPSGSDPAAHCYCGHQFGSFAGQLGDGAAILLGQVVNPSSGEHWELQLKGAGLTPYSRQADGRKVLRSSLREFLCSEAMHALRIPTTRAGTCITSDSRVQRDPFYDGKVVDERCTVVSRIAQSFIRFGSFEIFKHRDPKDGQYGRAGPSAGNTALQEQLLDFVLRRHYPHVLSGSGSSTTKQDQYLSFYKEIVERTAKLVAGWQVVGFVHGVLNTDNMSIMGLTIDYGPFGFLDQYDADFVPNGSDSGARYSYSQQPEICKWNLHKLAEALAPLLPLETSEELLEEVYDSVYITSYVEYMRKKLGVIAGTIGEVADDNKLVEELLDTMAKTHADFTDIFVALTEYQEDLACGHTATASQARLLDKILSRCARPSNVVAHFRRKLRIHRLSMHPQQIQMLYETLQGDEQVVKQRVNQMFGGQLTPDVLREEISGEKRKLDLLVQASETINKYEETKAEDKIEKDRELWSKWLEAYFSRLDRDSTSNSMAQRRLETMQSANPTVILRNWMAQIAIDKAEGGDYSYARALLRLLESPFNPRHSSFKQNPSNSTTSCSVAVQKEDESESKADAGDVSEVEKTFLRLPPEWADSLLCTCSS
jgi:serine/tyrosine/threonine adenylyltransferase